MRVLSFCLLILLVACGKTSTNDQNNDTSDGFSSTKSQFADYIQAHTGEVVSTATDIKIQLAKPLTDSLISALDNDLLEIEPKISGEGYWETTSTYVFSPETPLQQNTVYKASFQLGKVIPGLEKEKQAYKFTFQTLIQNFEVKIRGLKLYAGNDATKLRIEGEVQTADVAALSDIKKTLSAKQANRDLVMNWEGAGDNLFIFTIENVTKSKKESQVTISTDGSAIGVSKSEMIPVEIPSLDNYKVLSSQVVERGENYISVTFSDPIDPRQNLVGLVTLSGDPRPKLVVNVNELKIYPSRDNAATLTVTIDESVRNTAGFELKEDYNVTLQFTQVKPEVRFVGSDQRTIMPSGQALYLPFEATGLKAVDVTIIRVFADNAQQYLQVNRMGGTNQLRRVARPVARKTIPLNKSGVTNLNTWNRFELDLSETLTAEPGAIYQVQVGFQKRHSLYFCADNAGITPLDESMDEWGAEEESSYWDNYANYYNNNYRWEERDDPCSDSYYGSRRSVSKVLFASDLGLIAKKKDQGDVSVFVTDINTTSPLSNVTVQLFDYQQQEIGTGETDGKGIAELNAEGKPYLLVAKKGEQTGYLRLDDGTSLSLSNFDVSGTEVQKGLKGFLYGERGVWRPGDTLHLGFILEDIEQRLPDNHPVILELEDPKGKLNYRLVSSEPVGNMYRFDVYTKKDDPTGNWLAMAKVGGARFTKPIRIETIKPNRLKVNLTFQKDRFSVKDREITGDLDVRWLTGAQASNLVATYDLKLSPVKTTFKGWGQYHFDDLSKNFYSERETVYRGRLDASGKATVRFKLDATKEAPGALQANLYGKVFEEGGDFSISNTSVPYYPYSSYVGMITPEGDKRGMLLTDEDHTIQLATLDSQGQPVNRSDLQVKLYKLNWRWWWDTSYDNVSNYVGRSYRSPIQTDVVSTSKGKGQWKLRVEYPQWGRYYLQVTDPSSGHSTGKVIYMDWPGWAGKGKKGELDGVAMLDFSVAKDAYEVGEEMQISLPSTEGNRVLVSLETGTSVLDAYWVEASTENTSISIPVTADMAPNIYVHLTMVQPHSQTKNDLPIRLYGVQSIKVTDPSTVLEPVIDMPASLRPEQAYNVTISEKQGKPMNYSLAVVDEGLLDITNFKTPDPWSSFYAREALGIKTWDLYDDIIGASTAQIKNLLAVGGDAEIQPKEQKEANRFKPVVRVLGPFRLEAGKKQTHEIRLPQYIGSVKTMVVASEEGVYGHAEQATAVKQPLMVLATLPRVAGPGEQIKLPVNVFALTDEIGKVDISVKASGTLSVKGSSVKSTQFTGTGDEVIYFDLGAAVTTGVGKVTVTATSGSTKATYEVEMNVIARNPKMTTVASQLVSSQGEWSAEYEPLGLLGENGGTIEISTMPPLNLEQRVKYLIRYPHGCIEQTTSAAFAQLKLGNLTILSEQQSDLVQKNINAAIQRIRSFQLDNGGFSYWPGGNYANLWGSNYAGHFLVEAKKSGYAVPQALLNDWVSFQTKKAESWDKSSSADNDYTQSYRLYGLALLGKPALGAMNRMKADNSIGTFSKWRLALAYAVAGYSSEALEMVEGLPYEGVTNTDYYRYTYGSQARDKAMLLEAMISLDQEDEAYQLLTQLSEKLSENNYWMSTQTTAYCLVAISKYAEENTIQGSSNVEITVDGSVTSLTGSTYVHSLSIDDPDTKKAIMISNKGEQPVYVRLVRSGVPLEGDEEATSSQVTFDIRYEDMNGSPLDVTRLRQGTDFKAIVKVTNPGKRGHYADMALTQVFPSGWEVINTRLDGSGTTNGNATYMDIRDDRVMHYFDLKPAQSSQFSVLLNASYQGKYYLPAVQVEAMYDAEIHANTMGQWVDVLPE